MLRGADRGLPVMLLLGLALSGCLDAPVAPSSSSGVVAGAPSLMFDAVVVDAGRIGFEPTLAATPSGGFLICSPRGVSYGSDLWLSPDGQGFQYVGTAFGAFGPVVRSGTGDLGGGDCDVGADAGGRLYLVEGWLGSVSVASSSDGGATWRGTPLSIPAPTIDRPWVLGGEDDEVFVTAAEFQAVGFESRGLDMPPVGGLWVARSTDGGLTFPQLVLAVGNGGRIGLNSNLAAGGGNLFLAYTQKLDEGRFAVQVAASADRGLSWRQVVVAEQSFYPGQCLSPLDIFPAVAADAEGGVYVTWALKNPDTGRTDLFLAASQDGGEHWHPPWLVTDREGTRQFPWVAARDDGRVALAWYETNVTTMHDFTGDLTGDLRLTCSSNTPDDAEWFLRYAVVEGAPAAAPRWTEGLVQAAAIHRGDLDRPYAELLQVEFDREGRVAVAYVADVPEGIARPMFAREQMPPVPDGVEPRPGASGLHGWLVHITQPFDVPSNHLSAH